MKLIAQTFRHLRQMPDALATLSGLFIFFGPLSIIAAVFPIMDWRNNGRVLPYQEFWGTGAGILVVAIGLVMILLAIAFYRAQRWIRYGIPLGFVGLTVYYALWPHFQFDYEWAGALVWAIFSYWYFNAKRNVVAYFCGSPNVKPSAPPNSGLSS